MYSSGVVVVPWRRINLETVPSIYRALDATLEAARAHAANAVNALNIAPQNEWTEALAALPEFVVERAY